MTPQSIHRFYRLHRFLNQPRPTLPLVIPSERPPGLDEESRIESFSASSNLRNLCNLWIDRIWFSSLSSPFNLRIAPSAANRVGLTVSQSQRPRFRPSSRFRTGRSSFRSAKSRIDPHTFSWGMTVLLESLKRDWVISCNGGSQGEKGCISGNEYGVHPIRPRPTDFRDEFLIEIEAIAVR